MFFDLLKLRSRDSELLAEAKAAGAALDRANRTPGQLLGVLILTFA